MLSSSSIIIRDDVMMVVFSKMLSEHATLCAALLLNGLADVLHGHERATLSLSAAADALTLTLRQGVC